MRSLLPLLLVLAACRTAAVREPPPAPPPPRGPEGRIAVTAAAHGAVVILDRADLSLVRREPSARGAPGVPMYVLEDRARGVFYVANFNGGLARVPPAGPIEAIDLGGSLGGLSLSPDGARLAATGAADLAVRVVDLEGFRLEASVSIGSAADPPRHPLTHGLASPHPLWLDAAHLLVPDNVHEELVLVDAVAAQARSRVPVPSAVHELIRGEAQVIALAEGNVDAPASVLIFELGGQQVSGCADCGGPALIGERSVRIPLEPGEPAGLHHGILTPGAGLVLVANAGPRHGPEKGRTVAAVDLADGTVLWTAAGPAGAGHLAWLGDDRVMVMGHRALELVVLDATSGERLATWHLGKQVAPGHSLAVEPHDTVLLLDEGSGRVLRVTAKAVVDRSAPIGGGPMEASF